MLNIFRFMVQLLNSYRATSGYVMSLLSTAMRGAAAGLALLAITVSSPALAEAPPAPNVALGCAGCHGQEGPGVGMIPAIAGYDRDAFIAHWAEFQANERPATIMNRIARGYSDAEVAALADYFSSLR
jgi:cytochrome subunit of sulfide dehydrogenase